MQWIADWAKEELQETLTEQTLRSTQGGFKILR